MLMNFHKSQYKQNRKIVICSCMLSTHVLHYFKVPLHPISFEMCVKWVTEWLVTCTLISLHRSSETFFLSVWLNISFSQFFIVHDFKWWSCLQLIYIVLPSFHCSIFIFTCFKVLKECLFSLSWLIIIPIFCLQFMLNHWAAI